MNRYMELFVRSKDSESVECITVLSRNEGMIFDGMVVGDVYRHQVQNYYDELVSKGIISFVTTTQDSDRNGQFKIQAIEELQNIPSRDVYCCNYIVGVTTIEDLLIFAATINNIDYPAIINPAGNPYRYIQGAPLLFVAAATAAAMQAYPVTAVPLIAVSGIVTVAVVADAVSFINEFSVDRPKPSF